MTFPLRIRPIVVLALLASAGHFAVADESGFSTQQDENVVSVLIGGKSFAQYVTNDPETNKSYLWPVYGPSGIAMTTPAESPPNPYLT